MVAPKRHVFSRREDYGLKAILGGKEVYPHYLPTWRGVENEQLLLDEAALCGSQIPADMKSRKRKKIVLSLRCKERDWDGEK